MEIPNIVRRNWEHMLPEFHGKWDHWIICGDGDRIAIVHGMDLFEALDIIGEHFDKYSSIKVNLATLDSSGNVAAEDSHLTEVSNRINDRYLIEQHNEPQA
jgi:hypothetical protein